MNQRDAMKKALEALEKYDRVSALEFLRTALEEPEQDDTSLLRQALEALLTFQQISDFTPAQGVHAITALRERLGEKT